MLFIPLPTVSPHIHRILLASTLEGENAAKWLENPSIPTVRKACLMNILAVMCTRPSPSIPFIGFISRVFAVREERIYVVLPSTTLRALEDLCAQIDQPFYEDIESPLPVHLEILEYLPRNLNEDYSHSVLRSFRAEGAPSLQVVIVDRKSNETIADIDLDAHNPIEDVAGFFGHMWELWTGRAAGGITDHLKMWKTLMQTPAAEFVGYRLETK